MYRDRLALCGERSGIANSLVFACLGTGGSYPNTLIDGDEATGLTKLPKVNWSVGTVSLEG